MRTRLAALVVPRALGAEAVYDAIWLAGLLPGLRSRGLVALVLIGLRLVLSILQLVAATLLLRRSSPGRPLAMASLAGSAVLLVFEIGFRLSPTNRDPTWGWWIVGAYAVYAAWAIRALVRLKPRQPS